MKLKAIIFGSIGTLVETSELQRQAFNAAFNAAGLDWNWDKDSYQTMLSINGGQKRIRYYAEQNGTEIDDAQVVALHADKSARYQQMLRDNGLTLRDGVGELIDQALENHVKVAFATTTSAENVQAIDQALGDNSPYKNFAVVTNGDLVANSKPAPDVYTYVLNYLGVEAGNAIAIEDTAVSLEAARAADLVTVATPGAYAQNQDFSHATIVANNGEIADLSFLESLLGNKAEITKYRA